MLQQLIQDFGVDFYQNCSKFSCSYLVFNQLMARVSEIHIQDHSALIDSVLEENLSFTTELKSKLNIVLDHTYAHKIYETEKNGKSNFQHSSMLIAFCACCNSSHNGQQLGDMLIHECSDGVVRLRNCKLMTK